MVTRIAREIEDYVLELGTDGRLLSLQLEELVTGVDLERELVIRDYVPSRKRSREPDELLGQLENLSARSEEHTSELQSLMRISYAVFCLKKKNNKPYRT